MAENLAKEMSLPGVAGSDAHQVNELWTAYTEVEAFLDVNGILEAVKNGLVKAALNRKPTSF
jgi:histidinol phosphatase-like PHP family hydrolase